MPVDLTTSKVLEVQDLLDLYYEPIGLAEHISDLVRAVRDEYRARHKGETPDEALVQSRVVGILHGYLDKLIETYHLDTGLFKPTRHE